MVNLPYSAIARFTGVPASTIAYWHDRGFVPDSDDMEIIVKAIIDFLRKQLEEKKQENSQKGDKNNYFAEKTRLTSAQADKVELENAVRQGELFEAQEAERIWSAQIGACRARLLSLPTKLAPELAGITDPIAVQERLRSTIHEALQELSKINFEEMGTDRESGEGAGED